MVVGVERHTAVGFGDRQHGLGLDVGVLLVGERVDFIQNDGTFGENRRGIAVSDDVAIAEVAFGKAARRQRRRTVGDDGGVGIERAGHIADYRQWVEFEHDSVDPGLRRRFGFSRHRRNRIAYVAHFAAGQDVVVLYRPAEVAVLHKIRVSDDGLDAGNGQRWTDIQFNDARVRNGAAQHLRVQHPRHAHIPHILDPPRNLVRSIYILKSGITYIF